MRKTVWKTTALGLVACAMALTWTQSGQAQVDCVVERGQDPLDVLTGEAVKHNVWIGIDNSGSMSSSVPGDPLGRDRLDVAKDVLEVVINDVGDAVNWGFFYTVLQSDTPPGAGDVGCAVPQRLNPDGSLQTGNGSTYDFSIRFGGRQPNCVGLEQRDMTIPVACGPNDNREQILAKLLPASEGGIDHNGGTANAPSLDQIANLIANGFMGPDRPAGQKNVIIYLSDGAEDCACESDPVGSATTLPDFIGLPPGHPGFEPAPTQATAVLRVDGTPGAPVFQDFATFGSSSGFRAGFSSGVMARHALSRIDPSFDGSEGDIFIGYIFDPDTRSRKAANHWAWEASGFGWTSRPECPVEGGFGCSRPAFISDSADQLAASLLNVLAQVGVPEATVSLAASVVGSVKEVIATNTNPALTAVDLLASDAADTTVRGQRAAHRNNVLFTTQFTTPDFNGTLKAFNIFEVQADETRTADFTELWDAGELLRDRELSTDPRRIYFHRADGTGGQLSSTLGLANLLPGDLGVATGFLSEFDPTGVGAKTAEDAVEIVEKVIQGWRLVMDATDGFYQSDGVTLNFSEFEEDGTTRVWKLRESTGSSPAVVLAPPRAPDIDPVEPASDYQTFFDEQINRLTAVYMGTNGGMLNAFRADNGYELYAYISHDLLPKLPVLVRNLVAGANGIVNHQFSVASSPTVEDVFLQDAPSGNPEWRTVLTFGRGLGGKFLTALDITDVGEWDGTSSEDLPTGFQPPDLLFTVGNNDGVVDLDGTGENYDGLGETWSVPVMGRVQNGTPQGQWVLFAGSGYGCQGTEEGRFLYVLALEDGTVYQKLGPIPDVVDGAAGDVGVDQNALVATPALFNPHEPGVNDGRNFITRVYIGDLQGMVHKLDCTDSDPLNWEFGVFFEVTSEADTAPGQGFHDQPVAVQAALLKLSTTNRILIFLGTGGDSRVEREEPDRFKMVGIEDTDSVSPIAVSDPAFTGDLILTDTGDLFFFDLEEGHRVLVPPVAARNTSTNGVVFFASTGSDFDLTLCTETFSSLLTAVGVTGGLGSFDLDPTLAGPQGTVDLGAGRTTGLFHRDEHLYVSKSGGLGFGNETMVLGSDTFPTPPATSGNLQLLVETFRLSPF